ncbi:uncharacterized protein M6B38_171000 [Iris pallida]|uniref:Nuclear pore complex protein NUP1 n=1 Tax=Iris pallida TaxID=29817 RepID=A0AAX6EU29_IRIPA|nr:uncharacterized protein M6B38_171000 [Iris pallida]
MEERRGGYGDGAGGKLSRRSFRTRTPSTPYDRPARASKPDGWFSKLLLQPASKILPSFFPPRNQQDPPPQPEAEIEVLPELTQEDPGARLTPIYDEPGPSARYEQPEVDSKVNELVEDKSGNTYVDSGLAEIEQRLKEKKFSRDDTNRLIELLRSRTIDLPEDDVRAERSGPEDAETIPRQNHLRTSSKEDYPVHRTWKTIDAFQSTVHDVSDVETVPGQKNLRTSSKEEYPVHRTWKTTDPFQSTEHNVGSSPVEIAKAYMGARTVPSGYDCQNGQWKKESLSCNDNSVSKLPSTPVARSPICWPGAVVPSDHEYPTLQRGRIGFGPRTPYSGAIFPKSSSKFQVNGEKTDFSSPRWKQSSTHLLGSTKKTPRRMNSNLEDGFASVGPMRHVRPKNMTTTAPTGATPSRSNGFPFLSKTSDAFSAQGNLEPSPSKGGFLNLQSTNRDDEASEFAAGSLTVHPQSSKMAKRILEHLNRTVPSPKEKSSELKLAIARTTPRPTSSALVKDGQNDNPVISVSKEQRTDCLVGRDMVAQEGANAEKVLLGPSTSISNDKDGLKSPQIVKQTIFGLAQKTAANSEASNSSQETSTAAVKPSNNLNTCDNVVGFTFPVTSASNSFAEPPTPTMTSTIAASKVLETSGGSIPSFEFGSSRSDSRLVFSFGSSSNSDTTTPVFKFGNDNKPTLSFKPIGKDAFCC